MLASTLTVLWTNKPALVLKSQLGAKNSLAEKWQLQEMISVQFLFATIKLH